MGCGASKNRADETTPLKKPVEEYHRERETENEKAKDPEKDFQIEVEELDQEQGRKSPEEKRSPKKKKSTKKYEKKEEENTNTGIPEISQIPQERKRGLADISNLADLPDYEANPPDFRFRGRELSPIGTTRAQQKAAITQRKFGSQNLSSFEQEVLQKVVPQQPKKLLNEQPPKPEDSKPVGRQIRVRRQKTSMFNWPDSGEVEIKTISYKLVYAHQLKGFRTMKPKDQYLTSLLRWYKDKEEDIYEFSIRDTGSTNLRTGNLVELYTPQLDFQIDSDGKFIGLKDPEDFSRNVLAAQNAGKMTQAKLDLLQETITRELERTWSSIVEQWIFINKPENQELALERSQQYGRECALLQKINANNDEDFRLKLKKKLGDPNSYYKILSSNKMLKDKFKKWELHKDSTAKEKKYDENGQELQPHRNLKLNFIFTDKDEVMTTLVEPATLRPLISNYQNTKKIVFEVNRDVYIDVEFESKMSIFQWKGIEGLRNDDFLISEMVQFQDNCGVALADLMADVSSVPKIPLMFRLEKAKGAKEKENDLRGEIKRIDEEESERDNSEEDQNSSGYYPQ